MPNVTAPPRQMKNGQVIRQFVDTASTVSTTYTYPNAQEKLIIRNMGEAAVTATVGGTSQTIQPGGAWTYSGSFTAFSIQSASGAQAFDAWADEEGSTFDTPEGQYFWSKGVGNGGGNTLVANVKTFGATGNGTTDDLAAINNAMNAISPAGGVLYFPPGTYRISGRILLNGAPISIRGDGDSSVILIDKVTDSAVYLSGMVGTFYRDFKVASTVVYDNVNRNAAQQGIYIIDCQNVTVDNVSCDKMAATFCATRRSTDIKILNCYYKNTLADGIHITERSKRITIKGNHGDTPGDDGIAVVSYTSDTDYCEDIVIEGNIVKNGKARGITHVGGKRVSIIGNRIETTVSSGILTNLDTNYGTYAPIDTVISGNTVINGGQGTPKAGVSTGNQFGIEIAGGTDSCVVEGNVVRASKTHGITVATGTSGVILRGNNSSNNTKNGYHSIGAKGLTVQGNRSEWNGEYGAWFQTITESAFTGNVFYNNNTTSLAGADNCNFNGCVNCSMVGNISLDDRATKLVERGFEFNNVSNSKIGGNIAQQQVGASPIIIATNCSGIDLLDKLSGAGAPTMTMYVAGTQYIDTTNNKLYVYTGAGGWKGVAVA